MSISRCQVAPLMAVTIMALTVGVAVPGELASSSRSSRKPALERPRPIPEGPSWNLPPGGIDWANLKGRVVIVDFWSRKCGPCLKAIPELIEFRAKSDGQVEIVGLHVGMATPGDVERTVREMKIPYPVVMLPIPLFDDVDEANDWGVGTYLPSVALVDRKGRVRYTDLDPKTSIRRVKELLAER